MSIRAVTATKPGTYYDWRGPIIAYANVGQGMDPDKRDINMNDFRHIADYFLWYDYTPALTKQHVAGVGNPSIINGAPSAAQNSCAPKIKGVRINCCADQKKFHRPQFEVIEIPGTHSIFSSHDTSDIANRIGLPIFTQRLPNGESNDTINAGVIDDNMNQPAAVLHLRCDFKVDPTNLIEIVYGWGWPPKEFEKKQYSMLVVGQDQKPLSTINVEILCSYCRDYARPFDEAFNGEVSF
ncbi:hypothetical protein EJ08DRAFT_701195 [Tothia fuscella]|uniref:Uncharacterized protein n=1 Tax=Tothia fuscella TaxID=1048955 RepID=A0A9P4TTT7_9PEZI|nr:hypothetical protein EJ08DRAFT_701195 [Tothia fuscella]